MSVLRHTDIRIAWDAIKDGVHHVKEITDAPWRPEDLYAACVNGDAHLFTCPEGFVIVELQTDRYTLEREMFVIAAYGDGDRLLAKYQEELDKLARHFGATSITTSSPRPGFGRLSGWEQDCVFYRRRV